MPKDVYFLFCDRKTKKLPLADVPYVLRDTPVVDRTSTDQIGEAGDTDGLT